MSIHDETVSFSLEVNVEEAYKNVRQLQTVLYRSLSLMRRLGLPENVDRAIADTQRLIAVLNTLRLTMIAVQAASGPIGWALAAIGVAGTIMTAAEYGLDVLT